jgi:hypothetical protein
MIMPVAVVTLFSKPDPRWLQLSHNTYRLCRKGGRADEVVVPVQDMRSLMAMVPDESQRAMGDMWCAIYRPGSHMARIIDGAPEDREYE